jgi:hypothetical protein
MNFLEAYSLRMRLNFLRIMRRAIILTLGVLMSTGITQATLDGGAASAVEKGDDQLVAEGTDFVMRWMPESDKALITSESIKADVRWALETRQKFAWARQTPWEIYCNDVLPYAVVDEARTPWRQEFYRLFAPKVRDCTTGSEAALKVAASMKEATGVKYSTERSKPNQSALESVKQGKASCTGLSILLIDALRSVGIPARMAGILTWSHIPGNHSWVEAWCDGEWKMIEFAELAFDTPWVMDNIKKLDPSRSECRIWATTWRHEKGTQKFPLIWRLIHRNGELQIDPQTEVYGIDVTDSYLKRVGRGDDERKIYIDYVADPEKLQRGEAYHRLPIHVILRDAQGNVVAEGTTPNDEADMRQMLVLPLGDAEGSLEWTNSRGEKQSRPLSELLKAPAIHLHD